MRPTLTPEEFYHRRDDRTNRLTDSREYHNFQVRLVATETAINSFSGQVQLILAANMLARWCRRIKLSFHDGPLHPNLRVNGWTCLHERILSEIHQADPFGSFVVAVDPAALMEYTLGIGQINLGGANFIIDAAGWEADAGKELHAHPISAKGENPIGPAFAACLGVADAFKVATNQPDGTRIREARLSLWNISLQAIPENLPFPRTIDLGNVQLIGAGSVGSAIVYLLRMLSLNGRLTIIDHDLVEIENLNRSPLFGIDDDGSPKVMTCQRYLDNHLLVEPFPCKYDEYIEQNGRKPGVIDLLLPEANEYGVRAFVENNYPPLQVYGTTTRSWGINFHRHRPLTDEDCSLCRFPATIQPAMVCSVNQLEVDDGKSIDAALPFLSVGAAVLTVADLVRLQLPGYPQIPNFAFIDFKDQLETVLAYPRHPRPNCSCSSRSTKLQSIYNQSSKFFTFPRNQQSD